MSTSETAVLQGVLPSGARERMDGKSWMLVFRDEFSLPYEVSGQREGRPSRPLSFAGERYAPGS